MGPRLRLRTRIAILVAAGAIVVAVGVALLLSNTITLRNSANTTLRSDAYLLSVVNVERLVVDAETGLRGYVITRRPLFLQPTTNAETAFPAAAATLDRDAARAHAFLPQAIGLVQAAHSYLLSYVPRVSGLAMHDQASARSFPTTLEGKTRVDAIRVRSAALERLVSARENARQRAARSSATHAIDEAIVVLILLTVLTIAIGALLGRLAVARDRAVERTEATNQILQESLLPRALPDIPGCELAVRFDPAGAGELVGGDFYDVFATAPNQWAMVLGDVCGKGAEAAAVTAMARWTLRSRGTVPTSPVEALRFLNAAVLRQELGVRFITIVYVLLTVEGERVTAAIACAGHPAPILVPASGEPREVGARGTLLGVWPDVKLHGSEVQLSAGESLVLYTDGVSDQGPEHGADPSEVLKDLPSSSSAEQIAAALERSALRVPGRQRDDIAILALRFTGRAAARDPDADLQSVARAPMV